MLSSVFLCVQESVSVIHKLISDCEQKLLELLAAGQEAKHSEKKKKKEKVNKDPFSLKMANAFTKAYNYTGDYIIIYIMLLLFATARSVVKSVKVPVVEVA